MKLKGKGKYQNPLYILAARKYVINKSNKLVYYVKEELKFSKGFSGEVISCKVSTNTLRVFHAETTRIRHFHVVSTSYQYGTAAAHF